MLIEIHAIQNHAPSNLNRDDLGAPKTTMFGGYLRSRISSQCLKRSIRTSDQFKDLLGGVRTRRLVQLIEDQIEGTDDIKTKVRKRALKVLDKLNIAGKKDESSMLVYTTKDAISKMATMLLEYQGDEKDVDEVFKDQFVTLISSSTAVPDMALCGRMLEPTGDIWKHRNNTVEAALQAAHAISTHEARPEIDYYVAADDVKGKDAGAGFVDEALYSSSCFYKYFSIDWDQLVGNLGGQVDLAAHTVGAFIRAMALTTPSGKQNSYAAHNPPDGILVVIKKDNKTPISYANAFVKPVRPGQRDLVEESIAQLAQYVSELDEGFGIQAERYWFSPGKRYEFKNMDCLSNFDQFITAIMKEMGFDWQDVQKAIVAVHDA